MRALVIAAFSAVLAAASCTETKPNTATNVVVPGGKATPSPSAAAPTPTPERGSGPTWLLRDSGKRCVTHPCPSWIALDVKTREEKEITGIDVSAVGDDQKERILAGQVWVRGEIKTVPKAGPAGDGTVLFVNAVLEAHE